MRQGAQPKDVHHKIATAPRLRARALPSLPKSLQRGRASARAGDEPSATNHVGNLVESQHEVDSSITDHQGNEGFIKGGLTHNLFKSFGVKASLSGNNVVGLSTTKADNPAQKTQAPPLISCNLPP